jgi:hypothetical protein
MVERNANGGKTMANAIKRRKRSFKQTSKTIQIQRIQFICIGVLKTINKKGVAKMTNIIFTPEGQAMHEGAKMIFTAGISLIVGFLLKILHNVFSKKK